MLGLNATAFMKDDPWQVFEVAKQSGLKAVELTAGTSARAMLRADRDMADVERALRLSKINGLSIHSIGMHRDLSKPQALSAYLLLLEKAASLACGCVTTGVPDGCELPAYQEGLYRAACRAKQLGITICIETHGNEHGCGERLLPLLAVHPDLRICYDTGNVLFYSDATPENDLPLCIDRVAHLHLKDKIGGKGEWHFPALGEGTVDFPKLLALFASRTMPSASIEIEFTPDGALYDEVQRAVHVSVQYLKTHSLLSE